MFQQNSRKTLVQFRSQTLILSPRAQKRTASICLNTNSSDCIQKTKFSLFTLIYGQTNLFDCSPIGILSLRAFTERERMYVNMSIFPIFLWSVMWINHTFMIIFFLLWWYDVYCCYVDYPLADGFCCVRYGFVPYSPVR